MGNNKTTVFVRPPMVEIEECRSCNSKNLATILPFGETPIADKLLKENQLSLPEYRAPLTFVQCLSCGLAQILETVSPDVLFGGDYPYYSSVSPALMKHFKDSALNLINQRNLDANSLVIEAASNDGYMLDVFQKSHIPVLGIDPATGPAKVAKEKGIETLNTFFELSLAQKLAREGKLADVFLANNVLAHVPDLNGFVAAIGTILKPDGVAVIEVPYLLDLVEHCEFDTIYHQHLCYFSVTSLNSLFARHGLTITDVVRTSIHGGSLRFFASKSASVAPSVSRLLALEQEKGITSLSFFSEFCRKLEIIKTDMRQILNDLALDGARIVGYGAAAKATTLLHYLEIGHEQIDCILDKSPKKHGHFMPGSGIPIEPPELLRELNADYVMILAWNFAREIMAENKEYVERGGQFIVPIPHPEIVKDSLKIHSL